MGAAGSGVAPAAENGAQAAGPSTVLQRDLMAGADGLALAGCSWAVRAVGDRVHVPPAVADRRDLGEGPGELAGSSGRCRTHRVGGLGGLDCPLGPPARFRGPDKGASDTGGTPSGGLAAEPDDHVLGRSRGGLTTEIHLAVDASFHALAAVATAGQRGDAPGFTEVVDRIRTLRIGGGRPRTRPAHVLADRAYSSRAIRSYLRKRRIPHTIPEKLDQAGHRLRRGSAGGRPPAFDREMHSADTRPSAGSPS